MYHFSHLIYSLHSIVVYRSFSPLIISFIAPLSSSLISSIKVIRRKGTLRSSLIVMDEVLTHLDASGREAVGNVLRAMVSNPNPIAGPVPASKTSPGSDAAAVKVGDIAAVASENRHNDNTYENNNNGGGDDSSTALTDLPLVIEEADGVVTTEGQGLEGGLSISNSRTR